MPSNEMQSEVQAGVDASEPKSSTGLTYRVARDLEEVTAAWELVYKAYRRKELVDANPYRLHTAPQAIGSHAAVIIGYMGGLPVTTLTAIADHNDSLPLDRVYSPELTSLRTNGHRLLEVGLYADRRQHLSRSVDTLLELMRFAFYFAINMKCTDFVIGVHPRHARLYARAFGFENYGQPRTYPAVNHRPVVLLRGDIQLRLSQQKIHPALEFFAKNPVPQSLFAQPFAFEPDQIAGSVIETFLQHLSRLNDLGQAG